MQDQSSPTQPITEQGVALIDLVMERVRRNPNSIAGVCRDYPLVDPFPLAPEADVAQWQAAPPQLAALARL